MVDEGMGWRGEEGERERRFAGREEGKEVRKRAGMVRQRQREPLLVRFPNYTVLVFGFVARSKCCVWNETRCVERDPKLFI